MIKDHLNDKRIVERATVIGEKYFMDNYGVSVKFIDSQVMAAYVTTRVVLYGYIVGKEEDQVYISIDYRNYEVKDTGVPVDLEKKK